MPKCSLAILVVFAATSGWANAQDCATSRPLSPDERLSGWTPLSGAEGKALWTDPRNGKLDDGAWRFEGECIHRFPSPKRGSLYSAQFYDDFDLEFEWRISKAGNSGLKYLCVPGRLNPELLPSLKSYLQATAWSAIVALTVLFALLWAIRGRRSIFARPWPRRVGYGIAIIMGLRPVELVAAVVFSLAVFGWLPIGMEYQITDDLENADAKTKASHRTAALYDLLPAADGTTGTAHEFHRGRILVNGNHVEHWYDGRKVLEYNFGSDEMKNAFARSKFTGLPDMARKQPGLLELQDHADEVWFRYVRIRRLSGVSH